MKPSYSCVGNECDREFLASNDEAPHVPATCVARSDQRAQEWGPGASRGSEIRVDFLHVHESVR